MSHKTLVIIAVAILVVFGFTIFIYPEIFNPDDRPKTPLAVPNSGSSGVTTPAGK